jgi:hypothetical protein
MSECKSGDQQVITEAVNKMDGLLGIKPSFHPIVHPWHIEKLEERPLYVEKAAEKVQPFDKLLAMSQSPSRFV